MHYKEDYHSSGSQLLALIFEDGFGFGLVERMYKIKRVFSRKDGVEKGLSFYRLMEIIEGQESYFYQEIFNTH